MSKLNVTSLSKLSENLRGLSTQLAQRVAERCAEDITALAQGSFDKSEDPYGVPWRPNAKGETVDLVDTGDLRKTIRYVANGPKLRCALGVKYARYQIGKRPLFPTQGGALPLEWKRAIEASVQEVCAKAVAEGRT